MSKLFLLFGWAFLAGSFVPIDSSPYFVWLINHEKSYFLPIVVASVGNILGGIVSYLMGRKAGQYGKIQESKYYQRANKLVGKWGSFALFFSWVPFLGDVLVGLAGAMKLPMYACFFWMSVGKIARYCLLALTTLGVLKSF